MCIEFNKRSARPSHEPSAGYPSVGKHLLLTLRSLCSRHALDMQPLDPQPHPYMRLGKGSPQFPSWMGFGDGLSDQTDI